MLSVLAYRYKYKPRSRRILIAMDLLMMPYGTSEGGLNTETSKLILKNHIVRGMIENYVDFLFLSMH